MSSNQIVRMCSSCDHKVSHIDFRCPHCKALLSPMLGTPKDIPTGSKRTVQGRSATPTGGVAGEHSFQSLLASALTTTGRSGRLEYFVSSQLLSAVGLLILVLIGSIGLPPVLLLLFMIAFWVIAIGIIIRLSVRRLHDLNKSWLYTLWMFVPIANLVLCLALLFRRGDQGSNDYGPNPTGKIMPTYLIILSVAIVILQISYSAMQG